MVAVESGSDEVRAESSGVFASSGPPPSKTGGAGDSYVGSFVFPGAGGFSATSFALCAALSMLPSKNVAAASTATKKDCSICALARSRFPGPVVTMLSKTLHSEQSSCALVHR